MSLNINFFFTSPVEVVRVTPKNLEEVAKWCGGKVARVESRKVKGRVDSYVWVPTPDGSKISWAFPGMYISKRLAVNEQNELKETYSVFRKDYFAKNYFESPSVALEETWGRAEKERKEAARKARTITLELPEGANVEEAKAEIVAMFTPLEQIIVEVAELELEAEEVLQDAEEANPPSLVEQREEIHAEAVEAEADYSKVPRTIGDALHPFEAGDPSRA